MRHHGPVPNQVIEHRSSAHSAVITGAPLSAILAKPSPAKAAPTPNPHSRLGAHRLPAGSFIGGFRTPAPLPGSIAHPWPASETLPETSRSPVMGRTSQTDPQETFPATPADRRVIRKRSFGPDRRAY